MVKVMAINAGSSSLKFQLINMPSEEVITSGLVERIGLEQGNFEMKYNGEKFTKQCPIVDHSVAVQLLLDALIDQKVVSSLVRLKLVDIELFMVENILMIQLKQMRKLLLELKS